VKIVKNFNLVFGLQFPTADSDQVDVVGENAGHCKRIPLRALNIAPIGPSTVFREVSNKSRITLLKLPVGIG